jgi:hypothetical protein
MRPLFAFLIVGFALPGCIVVHDTTNPPPPPGNTCDLPTQSASASVPAPNHVAAGFPVSAADIGYTVTANGQGDYAIHWRAGDNISTCFTGIVTVQGTISPSRTGAVTGVETYQISAVNQLRFASVGGAEDQGINVGVGVEPIFLDAFVDGAHADHIFFRDGLNAAADTVTNSPAAFTSP